eukprot:4973034-Pyramimonas_sp.AAC.1
MLMRGSTPRGSAPAERSLGEGGERLQPGGCRPEDQEVNVVTGWVTAVTTLTVMLIVLIVTTTCGMTRIRPMMWMNMGTLLRMMVVMMVG